MTTEIQLLKNLYRERDLLDEAIRLLIRLAVLRGESVPKNGSRKRK